MNKGWNPYPMVRYSERPDVVSAHLLEGHVCVFVDTSPSVMILPTTFFHHVQHAEEYRQTPFIGTYLRWVRFAGIMTVDFLAAAVVYDGDGSFLKASGIRIPRSAEGR